MGTSRCATSTTSTSGGGGGAACSLLPHAVEVMTASTAAMPARCRCFFHLKRPHTEASHLRLSHLAWIDADMSVTWPLLYFTVTQKHPSAPPQITPQR